MVARNAKKDELLILRILEQGSNCSAHRTDHRSPFHDMDPSGQVYSSYEGSAAQVGGWWKPCDLHHVRTYSSTCSLHRICTIQILRKDIITEGWDLEDLQMISVLVTDIS